jgi:hypothetical protein
MELTKLVSTGLPLLVFPFSKTSLVCGYNLLSKRATNILNKTDPRVRMNKHFLQGTAEPKVNNKHFECVVSVARW